MIHFVSTARSALTRELDAVIDQLDSKVMTIAKDK
jgi:hypothetical protein